MSFVSSPPVGRQLVKAASVRSISSESPFWFGNLIHVYLELRLKVQDLEGAESVSKAKLALEYIRKAADAAHLVCEQFDGQVLEIHGRTLHLGLPYATDGEVEARTKQAVALLHVLLRKVYGSGGPEGWRMAADHAPTLTVESEGIHEDTSLVSLSPAANYPAKALGKKLVSWGELGARIQGKWGCVNLDDLVVTHGMEALAAKQSYGSGTLVEAVMEKRAKVVNFASVSQLRHIEAKAAPIGGNGTVSSPTTENPFSCFGFVLSMDLDGFTKRVDVVARGTPQEQAKLAGDFLDIMKDAADFARERPEDFVQFPFAGDNAIFAVTASRVEEFGVLKKRRPIEIAVQWEAAMGDKARMAGFGGWGQSAAAGGTPHGNSKGNLHVGGIVLGERRFLVGIGPGMRYARQAFVHVSPGSDELAMSSLDTGELHPRLAKEFSQCDSSNGGTSSYYRKATLHGLAKAVSEIGVEQKALVGKLAFPSIQLSGPSVPNRPYFCH
jgi:predicted DNA-binding ribbon-helix-helix protein